MSRSMRLTVAAAALLVGATANAGWAIKGDASLSFTAYGNVGMKVAGVCKGLTASDDGKAVTLTTKLADCDTDMGLRNRHMLEDMEAEKFPTVSLSVPLDAIKLPADGAVPETEATGKFTLHGVVNEKQTLKYSGSCKGGTCTLTAKMTINVKEPHGIKIRSYMGVTVKPDVQIEVSMTVAK